jgi:hypothetical protein
MLRYHLARRIVLAVVVLLAGVTRDSCAGELLGEVVDSVSGRTVAARIYIHGADGSWHLATAADPAGSAIGYSKQYSEHSVEIHTAVSPHRFRAELPAGRYEIVAERGKEYVPARESIEMTDGSQSVVLKLERFADMANECWYSGETHVHRTLDDLPTAMLADDLNVALPLTYWVTRALVEPASGDKNASQLKSELIEVDATHVIYPLNTEYEIFTVGQQRHTLGAVFALNHKSLLKHGVPPVTPIAEQVHREGGLLELDKHNWPWSMMLVPVMQVDLYELTNNHLWRTGFHFQTFGEQPPEFMQVERDDVGMTERGWLDFTLKNYYALLNCGFRMRPTAGTATGVHPVPLGFGRVYVELPGGFSYAGWMEGLNAGRSFVTTGPLLTVRVNDQPHGHRFEQSGEASYHLVGGALSADKLTRIELVSAGKVVRQLEPENRSAPRGGWESRIDMTIDVDRSTWLAVRCFAEPEGRIRFAHTAPWFIDVVDRPLVADRAEVAYLISRVQTQLERERGVLSAEAIAEYERALAAYRGKLAGGR